MHLRVCVCMCVRTRAFVRVGVMCASLHLRLGEVGACDSRVFALVKGLQHMLPLDPQLCLTFGGPGAILFMGLFVLQLGMSDKAMMHTNWAMDLDPKASNNAMAKDTMDDYGAPSLPDDMASTPPPEHSI